MGASTGPTEDGARESIEALDARLRVDPDVAAAARDRTLVVVHHITDPAPGTVSTTHLRLGAGEVRAGSGLPAATPADVPVVHLVSDAATAAAIRHGQLGARTALLTGRLRLEGEVSALVQHADLLPLLHRATASDQA